MFIRKKQEPPLLSPAQKQKLEELLFQEEVAGEKRVNRIYLMVTFLAFIAIGIQLLAAPFYLNDLSNIIAFSLIGLYSVVVYILLKKNRYHRVIKYLTCCITVTAISVMLIGYSFYSGWLHTLRTGALMTYCGAIFLTGFYQKPSLPLLASGLISLQYLGMFLFAYFSGSITLGPQESFYEPLYNIGLLFFYLPIFNIYGLVTALLARRMRIVLSKTIYTETEIFKKEIERKTIEEASRQKINFFINLSHEMKTPLTLLGNYLEKYIQEKGPGKEGDIVLKNFHKMERDIVNFMDLEKLESGKIIYDHNQMIDFSSIVNDKIEIFRVMADKKEITLKAEIEPDLHIYADPYAIDRIINNLLENAVKFTPTHGWIYLRLANEKEWLCFEVADNGMAIPDELKEHVFEPYYQISRKKSNLQGMGLGLSVVKKIVDQLQGEIRIDDLEPSGVSFSIRLKREFQANIDENSGFSPAAPLDSTSHIKLIKEEFQENRDTVLLVEDNLELLAFLQENLLLDYNVVCAMNGYEALEKLDKFSSPSIIISDIMMEEMDGYEFYERFQVQYAQNNIPFIFLTARTGQDDKLKALENGAVDFISKPFDVKILLAKIKSILDNQAKIKSRAKENLMNRFVDFLNKEKGPDYDKFYFKYRLTPREIDVARLLIKGLLNKEIALKLHLSLSGVKKHIISIYEKCGVNRRSDFIRLVHREAG